MLMLMNPAAINPVVPLPPGVVEPVGLWQLAALIFGAVIVVMQVWRGWHNGFPRQTMEIVAVGAAYAAGYFGAPYAAPLFRSLAYPEAVLKVFGGAAVALAVFVAVSIVGMLLFKKTAKYEGGFSRTGIGLSGALVGALFGVACLWAGLLAVRLLGTLAETKMRPPAPAGELPTERGPRAAVAAGAAGAAETAPPPWIHGLADLKHSLDDGLPGRLSSQVDPVPPKFYGMVKKAGQVMADERSVDRFMTFPTVRPLAENPKILALRDDEALVRAAQAWDWPALLSNKRLVQAANDPEVAALLRKVDLEKALDYALSRPQYQR